MSFHLAIIIKDEGAIVLTADLVYTQRASVRGFTITKDHTILIDVRLFCFHYMAEKDPDDSGTLTFKEEGKILHVVVEVRTSREKKLLPE